MFAQIKERCEGERKSEYVTHFDFCAVFIARALGHAVRSLPMSVQLS